MGRKTRKIKHPAGKNEGQKLKRFEAQLRKEWKNAHPNVVPEKKSGKP